MPLYYGMPNNVAYTPKQWMSLRLSASTKRAIKQLAKAKYGPKARYTTYAALLLERQVAAEVRRQRKAAEATASEAAAQPEQAEA